MFARTRRLALLLAGATALAALGCGAGNVSGEPAVKSPLFIRDRGIAVPVPPPSLTDQPKVDARIWGDITGDFVSGTPVHLLDVVSGFETEVASDPESCNGVDEIEESCDFLFEDVPVDLTDNCLEFWLDGEAEAIATYRADIGEDDDGMEIPVMVDIDACGAVDRGPADAH